MAFDFTGKLVLVTGGSAGIGAEISKGIVAGGGHVIVCSRHEDTGREVDDKEWNNTINTNLTGTYNVTHALWQHFIDRGGARIVNVSSVAGKIGGGLLGTVAYASSKAGMNGFTKAIAKEGGKYGISCNAVCPSFTITDMTTALSNDEEKYKKVVGIIPLGRPAQASEPAQMVLFFASDAASFVNGEVGDCDGGIVMD